MPGKADRTRRSITAALGLVGVCLLAVPGGQAAVGTGGLEVERPPKIRDAYCVKQCVSRHKATPGGVVRVVGERMEQVKVVVFPGKRKRIRVKPHAKSDGAVRVKVPKRAADGRPYVVAYGGVRSNRSSRELRVVPVATIPVEVFPVRGPYSYGSAGATFGAGRPGHKHQGQDVLAACGTRLVSVKKAEVVYNQYQKAAAGWYVVLKNLGTNTYFAYMHLIRRAKVEVGERVAAGQPIGRVGETGRASGCHLHFEYWIGPWQTGGHPIDPLPYLKSL